MLDEDAEEPLDGAQQRPVHHDRLVLVVVGADVAQPEPLREVEVELHRRQLPGAPDGVDDLDVDLGTVERGLALDALVRHAAVVEDLCQRRLGELPDLIGALVPGGVLRVAAGQLDLVLGEAERLVHHLGDVEAGPELRLERVLGAEDVSVVLREAAHPHQPVQRSRALEAIDRAELREPHRQVAIAALARVVDPDVEGAVHRLDLVALPVDLHRRIHAVAVVGVVPALVPQRAGRDVRREQQLIAVGEVGLAPVVLDLLADEGAVGQPQHQAAAELLRDLEELQVLAQPPMVPLGGLLEKRQVSLELVLRLEREAVDAGQHLPLLVTAPVGASEAGELEVLHLLGVADVRTGAHIGEVAVLVEADGVGVEALDQLLLVGLVVGLGPGGRLLAGRRVLLELQVALGDLAHPLLDGLERLIIDGRRHLHVVIEAVLDGRADGEARPGIQLGDGRRHEVRRAVADRVGRAELGCLELGLGEQLVISHVGVSCVRIGAGP